MQKLQAATPNFGYKQIRRTDLNLWVQEFKKCKCILGLTVETIQSYISLCSVATHPVLFISENPRSCKI